MNRYVDIEPYKEYVLQRHYRNSMGECIETVPLCGLPTADVQEVRHGRWIGYNTDKEEWKRTDGSPVFMSCSECHGTVLNNGSAHWNYCPNCGVKMDECEVVSETGTPPEWGDRSWAFKGGAKMDEEESNAST